MDTHPQQEGQPGSLATGLGEWGPERSTTNTLLGVAVEEGSELVPPVEVAPRGIPLPPIYHEFTKLSVQRSVHKQIRAGVVSPQVGGMVSAWEEDGMKREGKSAGLASLLI